MAVIGSSMTAMEDALNVRSPLVYHAYEPVTQHPTVMMAEAQAAQARMSVAMQANLQNRYTDSVFSWGENAYANAYRAPQEPTTADKLNAWYARLEERVAQIEADDAVMGKKETKRWMDELAAFKVDLS